MSEQHFDRFGEQTSPRLNPWKSMWLHPKLTIRYLVNTDPKHYVLLLAIAGGINTALSESSRMNLGNHLELTTILTATIIGGTIMGLFGLYVSSWLLCWTGSWIGGRSTSEHIRTVIGWANMPNLWQLLLWAILLAALGIESFTTKTPNLEASPALWGVVGIVAFISGALGIWSLVMVIAGIAEVQGFSALKAFANIMLVGLITLVFAMPILVIGFIFAYSNGGLLG